VPKRIVVPLDGSPRAEALLTFIEELARPLDAEIVLVRVEPPASRAVLTPLPAFGEDALLARHHAAQHYLAGQVRIGDAAPEIVAVARETGADLIAMTTRGQSALRRLLVGSTADAVLRTSAVPVVLFHATAEPRDS
jgi:nucleotide-binding universal stress UspA family protein